MNNSRFALLLLLSGCSTNTSVCPQIRTYTYQEQLAQASAEEKLSTNSPLIQPLLEWASLRSQLKACSGN